MAIDTKVTSWGQEPFETLEIDLDTVYLGNWPGSFENSTVLC